MQRLAETDAVSPQRQHQHGAYVHGTRAVAALVALANDRSIEQINKQQGWRERSDMCNCYARLQQVQYFAQQPVLRESLADTLAVDYAAFFK